MYTLATKFYDLMKIYIKKREQISGMLDNQSKFSINEGK